MPSESGFPIQQLPYPAMEGVLEFMNPVEIIKFSRVSLKSTNIVKRFARSAWKNRFKLSIFVAYSVSLIFIYDNNRHWIYQVMRSETSFFQMDGVESVVFEDVPRGLMLLTDYISGLLGCHISHVNITLHPSYDAESVVNWLSAKNRTYEYCDVVGSASPSKLNQILEKLKVSKRLTISVTTSMNYRMPSNSMGVENLIIRNGAWVDMDHLTQFEGSAMSVCNSTLSGFEIIGFLQSWQHSKSNFKLKNFEVTIETDDMLLFAQVLIDANSLLKSTNVRVIYNEEQFMVNGVEFWRIDGKRAVLYTRAHMGQHILGIFVI